MTDEQAMEFYGKDATEWLRRWDAGDTVWSIEMGGLGPAYEQCIHITCAEIVRHMLAKAYDHSKWADKKAWGVDRDDIEKMGFSNPVVKELGLSGAQWGAALNLACHLYMHGPAHVMKDKRVKDRMIQVQRTFPAAHAA